MKKRKILIQAVILSLFLIGGVVLPAYAQGEAPSGQELVLTTQVEGNSALVAGGRTTLTLEDGTRISVEGETLPENLLFVVHEIDPENQEIYGAVAQALAGKGTKLRLFDIYFIDQSGNHYTVPGKITLSIGLNGGYANPVVYYIAENGSTTLMEGTTKNDQFSFETDHNSYYALLEKAGSSGADITPTSPEPPVGTSTTGTVSTGYTKDRTEVICLLLALGGFGVWLFYQRRKKA